MSKTSKIVPILAVALMSASFDASACAVCYGNPDSDMVKGAKAGVIFLIIMIYAVLMAMAGIAGYWYHRAKKLAEAESAATAASTSTPPQV